MVFQVGTQRRMTREGKYVPVCKVNDTQVYPSDSERLTSDDSMRQRDVKVLGKGLEDLDTFQCIIVEPGSQITFKN